MGRVVFEGMIFFNDTVSKHQNENVFKILSNLLKFLRGMMKIFIPSIIGLTLL